MSECREFIVVFSTASSREEAERIAASLLDKRLAACVSISAVQQSWYFWQDRVHRDEELTLMIKTRAKLFNQVEKDIRENHSYEVPEIIALPLADGAASYLNWMDEFLRK